MRIFHLARLAAALALSLLSVPLHAEPGDTQTTSGVAGAEIIDPGRVVKLDDLRFAAFASPAAAATMTIDPDGTVTATGDVAATMNSFTSPGGRGPARFRIDGMEDRFFTARHPNSVTISNGTSTMLVDNMEDNIRGFGRNARFDENGRFDYFIGGRLNVGANQEPGEYSGDFEITVAFH